MIMMTNRTAITQPFGQRARLESGSRPNRPRHSPSPQRLVSRCRSGQRPGAGGGNCSTAGEEKVWNRLPIVCLWSMAPCWDSSRHTPAIANFTTGSCRDLAQSGLVWVIAWPILGWTSLVLTSLGLCWTAENEHELGLPRMNMTGDCR